MLGPPRCSEEERLKADGEVVLRALLAESEGRLCGEDVKGTFGSDGVTLPARPGTEQKLSLIPRAAPTPPQSSCQSHPHRGSGGFGLWEDPNSSRPIRALNAKGRCSFATSILSVTDRQEERLKLQFSPSAVVPVPELRCCVALGDVPVPELGCCVALGDVLLGLERPRGGEPRKDQSVRVQLFLSLRPAPEKDSRVRCM